jgi:hypothetical protein
MSERLHYIYRHTRRDNGDVFYIGQGVKPLDIKYPCEEYRRAFADDKKTRNEFWQKTVKKAGGFDVEIMLDDIPSSEIDAKEIEFIALYGRKDKLKDGRLVNLTDGGKDAILERSKEVIKQIAITRTRTVSQNIEEYVFPEPNTGCFIWIGSFEEDTQHMKMHHGKKHTPARKSIYEYLKNIPLTKADYVVNTCGFSHCVNPDHAKLVRTKDTPRPNRCKGEAFHKTILTEDKVKEIFRLNKEEGLGSTRLGIMFNVHRTTIGKILTGHNWAWVNG